METNKKYHIKENTVQETLVIPLFARKTCSIHYPHLFEDKEAEMICENLDYDFKSKEKKMNSVAGLFGALEVAQRHYDLICEINAYLKQYPQAAVVNMGCGLDDTFSKVDNGFCKGYNIDFPEIIEIRNAILPTKQRETNIAADLCDHRWFEQIDARKGAIFFASGVFYYIDKYKVRELFAAMSQRFPEAVLVFDSCNRIGARMMTKTWLKEAGIGQVNALFSLENEEELRDWSSSFKSVSSRSYMCGYRDIRKDVSMFYRLMIYFCDHIVRMKIVKIEFC